jgi:tetratricopeptide (TPR) repeat protein
MDDLSDSVEVETLISIAATHYNTNPQKALDYAIEAKELSEELRSEILLGKAMNTIGAAYYYLDVINLSDSAYFIALNSFDSIGFKPGMARSLNNIAWNYKVREDYEKALVYFERAHKVVKATDDTTLLQGILNNMGTVLRQQGQFEKALEVFEESLELNRVQGNEIWEAYALNNMGMTYMDLGNFQKSREFLDQAIRINLENDLIKEYSRNLTNLGKLYISEKEYDSADYYLDMADEVIDSLGYNREKLENLEYKILLNEEIGDWKNAFVYQKEYQQLDNELNRISWNEKVSELQGKFELAQKERELETSRRKLEQQKMIIMGSLSILVLLFVLLYLVIKLYRSKNEWGKNIENLNLEINQKNEQLEAVNRDISQINENLEEMVKKRTEKAFEQNERLLRYAFINSHEIRGPLARILGLLYLIKLEDNSIQRHKSFRLLDEATNELDDVIKQTSKLLEDEELFDDD